MKDADPDKRYMLNDSGQSESEGKKNNSQSNGNKLKSPLDRFKKIMVLLLISVIVSIVFLVIFILKNNEKEKEIKEKDEDLKIKDADLKKKEKELNDTKDKLNGTTLELEKKEKELNDTKDKLNGTTLELEKKEKKLNVTKWKLNKTIHKLKEKQKDLNETRDILKKIEEELKRERYNKEILIEENTNENDDDIVLNYTINESAKYRICLYGPKASNGGKGCVQCAERYFENGSIIEYQLGGRASGGKGGEKCGDGEGYGYNGAGLSSANFSDEFYIVAGGGGGNSEIGTRGGDCQQDGEGKNGGKGAKKNETGKGGRYNPEGDGKEGKGGNGGGQNEDTGVCCGGGGGSGYFGGGGGGFGYDFEVGGGGGGSSYCNETKGVICHQTSINIFNYSKLEIYKKVFEE